MRATSTRPRNERRIHHSALLWYILHSFTIIIMDQAIRIETPELSNALQPSLLKSRARKLHSKVKRKATDILFKIIVTRSYGEAIFHNWSHVTTTHHQAHRSRIVIWFGWLFILELSVPYTFTNAAKDPSLLRWSRLEWTSGLRFPNWLTSHVNKANKPFTLDL